MKRLAIYTAFLAAQTALSAQVLAGGVHDGGENYNHMGEHFGWGMMFGPFMMIAVTLMIVMAVVYFLRGRDNAEEPDDNRSALSVLNERYAKGDIDHDEFEERRRRLTA